MTFLPNDIWIIINSFLGVNYWYNRKKLTVLSKAVDFITSDYSNNSYWKWNRWRKNKYNLDIHIIKPTLPHRFRNEHHSVFIMPFNQSTRSTRGMSYDIRCIPKINRKNTVWLNSHIEPNHYGKCLELK